jgi:GGDEF domain-containing protein
VILHDDPATAAPVAAATRRALTDARDGLVITTSRGEVALPAETAGAEAALKLADARMYAAKRHAAPRSLPPRWVLARTVSHKSPSRRAREHREA